MQRIRGMPLTPARHVRVRLRACVYARVHVRLRLRACVYACVHVSVRLRVCVHVCAVTCAP